MANSGLLLTLKAFSADDQAHFTNLSKSVFIKYALYHSGTSQAKVILFSFSSIANKVLTVDLSSSLSKILIGNINQEPGNHSALSHKYFLYRSKTGSQSNSYKTFHFDFVTVLSIPNLSHHPKDPAQICIESQYNQIIIILCFLFKNQLRQTFAFLKSALSQANHQVTKIFLGNIDFIHSIILLQLTNNQSEKTKTCFKSPFLISFAISDAISKLSLTSKTSFEITLIGVFSNLIAVTDILQSKTSVDKISHEVEDITISALGKNNFNESHISSFSFIEGEAKTSTSWDSLLIFLEDQPVDSL
jgi:hypothetical protein